MQLSLDMIYRSLGQNVLQCSQQTSLLASLCATDPSEAQVFGAQTFLDNVYGAETTGNFSRAGTPMTSNTVCGATDAIPVPRARGPRSQWSILSIDDPLRSASDERVQESLSPLKKKSQDVPHFQEGGAHQQAASAWKSPSTLLPRVKNRLAKLRFPFPPQDPIFTPCLPRRRLPPRPHIPTTLPPDISDLSVELPARTEYAILISMYEVYNDRIFDLLSSETMAAHPAATPRQQSHNRQRRHLLFKPTEMSPDRKVVAGLKKVVCGSYEEALMVLETGLMERRVAGTGSNSVSSRSHGFFVVEVKRRIKGGMSSAWNGANLTIVDLAGESCFYYSHSVCVMNNSL